MRQIIGLFVVTSLAALNSGCATSEGVRYVYQDGEYGVVGLPENTDRWPTHYRQDAEKLMEAHFPEGHEVVRAEEVVEGSRTIKLEGSKTAEVAPELPTALLKVAKLGHSASHSQSDTMKLKECRIIYRRAGGPGKPEGYAEAPSLTPTLYVDPNALERRKASEQPRPAKVTEAATEGRDDEPKGPTRPSGRPGRRPARDAD